MNRSQLAWHGVCAQQSKCCASSAETARRRRAGARCLGNGTARKLSTCAHRAALLVVGLYHIEGRCAGKRPRSFRCMTVVRRASCGLQRQASAAYHTAQARKRSLSLRRRRTTWIAERTCRATQTVVSSYSIERSCASKRSLPLGARPWCNVPAAASDANLSLRVTRRRRTGAHCPWEEAQHSTLLSARTLPRWS